MARQRARHLRYELEQECSKADVETAAFAKQAREDHVNNLMEISHEHDETTAKNFDNRRAYEQQTKELMVVSVSKFARWSMFSKSYLDMLSGWLLEQASYYNAFRTI